MPLAKQQDEVFRRSQGWQPSYYYRDDVIELESAGLSLSVQVIYERVKNNDIHEFLKEAEGK